MPIYEWKNIRTGKIVETTDPVNPPKRGKWTRVFSIGLGRTEGAGGSPSRPSLKK